MVAPGFSAKLKEKKTEDKKKSKEKAKSEKTEATSQKKTSFDSKDSNSKGEGEKVDRKNEDFEEVYHKSESEDKNGDFETSLKVKNKDYILMYNGLGAKIDNISTNEVVYPINHFYAL